MMEMAKVTSKGQITIPISIRRKLGISEGDKILFINKEDGVLMVNPDTFQGDITDETIELPAKPKATKRKVKVPVKKTSASSSASAPVAAPVPTPRHHTAELVSMHNEAQEVEELTYEDEVSQDSLAPIEYAADTDDTEQSYAQAAVTAAPATHEPNENANVHTGGVNLSTLLDDIRSIGSNI